MKTRGILSKLVLVGASLGLPGLANALPIVADSINESATNANTFWIATEVGWLYTPTSSFSLVGINTRFGSSDGRTVTVEVYDEQPTAGGTLLRSAGYVLGGTGFEGALFAALDLTAGEDYFFGFRNVGSLNVNVTDDAGATNLPGGLKYSFSNDGSYSQGPETGFTAQPIVQFLSDNANPVPEPSTVMLLGLGLAAIGVRRKLAA
jgi:hypothetical protein